MLLFHIIKTLFDNIYISDIEHMKGTYIREKLIRKKGFSRVYTGELYLSDEHFYVIARSSFFKRVRITGINADKYDNQEIARQKSKILANTVNSHITNNTNNIRQRINYRTNMILLSIATALTITVIEAISFINHIKDGFVLYDLIGLLLWGIILSLCYVMSQRVQ